MQKCADDEGTICGFASNSNQKTAELYTHISVNLAV